MTTPSKTIYYLGLAILIRVCYIGFNSKGKRLETKQNRLSPSLKTIIEDIKMLDVHFSRFEFLYAIAKRLDAKGQFYIVHTVENGFTLTLLREHA